MGKQMRLITGGARSGKSGFALRDASALAGAKAFLATATAGDEEMSHRIDRHKKERGKDWVTFEEPIAIGHLLTTIESQYGVILVDCLTLWLTNVMMAGLDREGEMEKLIASLSSLQSTRLYLVANEVGAGIVPDNELAREFRDAAGILNQKVAALADEVYLTVAGIPLKIKGENR